MKTLFTLTALFLFSLSAFAQADSNGFTNKTEAENKIIHKLKEGKWILYIDSDQAFTTDANAPYYCKA